MVRKLVEERCPLLCPQKCFEENNANFAAATPTIVVKLLSLRIFRSSVGRWLKNLLANTGKRRSVSVKRYMIMSMKYLLRMLCWWTLPLVISSWKFLLACKIKELIRRRWKSLASWRSGNLPDDYKNICNGSQHSFLPSKHCIISWSMILQQYNVHREEGYRKVHDRWSWGWLRQAWN